MTPLPPPRKAIAIPRLQTRIRPGQPEEEGEGKEQEEGHKGQWGMGEEGAQGNGLGEGTGDSREGVGG